MDQSDKKNPKQCFLKYQLQADAIMLSSKKIKVCKYFSVV